MSRIGLYHLPKMGSTMADGQATSAYGDATSVHTLLCVGFRLELGSPELTFIRIYLGRRRCPGDCPGLLVTLRLLSSSLRAVFRCL